MTGQRRIWIAVSALFVLSGGAYGLLASRIPAVVAKHQLSHGALGGLLVLPVVGAILAFPYAGQAADRYGAAKLGRWLAVAVILTTFLLAAAPVIWTLAVALFLLGASQGALDVSMNSWAAEAERHALSPMMSSFHAMFSLGNLIGAASGYVAASYAIRFEIHFVITGLVLLAVCAPLARVPWQSRINISAARPALVTLPRGPLLLAGLMAFCAALGEGGVTDWGALLLLEITEASEAQAALGFAVFASAMVLMRFAGDRAIARIGPLRAAQLAGGTAAAGVAITVLTPGYGVALLGFLLMGLGYAVVFPLAFGRAANDPDRPAGAAIASVATLAYGGALLGPPLLGLLAQLTSLRLAFAALGLLAAGIILLGRALYRSD